MGSDQPASEDRTVASWDLRAVDLRRHLPEILSSADEARAVALEIPEGESLQDHEVHERASVSVLDREVEISTAGGQTVAGGSGLTVESKPGERNAGLARTAWLGQEDLDP